MSVSVFLLANITRNKTSEIRRCGNFCTEGIAADHKLREMERVENKNRITQCDTPRVMLTNSPVDKTRYSAVHIINRTFKCQDYRIF